MTASVVIDFEQASRNQCTESSALLSKTQLDLLATTGHRRLSPKSCQAFLGGARLLMNRRVRARGLQSVGRVPRPGGSWFPGADRLECVRLAGAFQYAT